MALFLPTHTEEYKLWLDEVMGMLPWFSYSGTWNAKWQSLLCRLASDQMGKIDWTPYLDTFYTMLTRFLDLPVGRKHLEIGKLSKNTNADFTEIFFGDDDPVNEQQYSLHQKKKNTYTNVKPYILFFFANVD